MSKISKESTDGKAHSILGASSSHRWLHCPASVRMSQLAPPSKGSQYAMEGTAAHDLAEKCLLSKKNPEDFKGEKINGFEVTDEMIEAVNVYVNLVRSESKGKPLKVEQRFNLNWLYPGMFGTNDACVEDKSKGVLRVYDYKHGAGIAVEVVENSQLIYYGIGAARDIAKKTWKPWIKSVELIIVQPRAYHHEGPVRRWSLSIKELDKWAGKLKTAAEMTTWEDAPLFAGSHCQFCNAAGLCPELHNKAQETARTDFKSDLPDPTTLSKEQIIRVVKNAGIVKTFLSACEKLAYEMAMDGQKMEGLKLVRKRGSRVWSNPEEAIQEFGEMIYDKKMKTPAQMEKLVDKKRVAELITKVEGDLTIASSSDRRKEVNINPSLDFKEE